MNSVQLASLLGRLSGSSREFRDALTRASGSVDAAHTEVVQWDRWTP